MPTKKFLIAPLNDGQTNYTRPWLIGDDAYETMRNAYSFRGRVRKRFGGRLLNGSVAQEIAPLFSRLRINIGVTPGPLPVPEGMNAIQIGSMFSVGDDMFTVWQLGAGVTTFSTNPAITATINTTVNPNTVTFAGAVAGTDVFFYPSFPVMGFASLEIAPINNEPTFAFDTRFAYEFAGGGWQILGPIPPAAGSGLWTGSNSQLFWSENFRGVLASETLLFVTNFNVPDGIKFWNPTTSVWTTLVAPTGIGANTIQTARVIKQFSNRLLLFNTVELQDGVSRRFRNRVRWSRIGAATTADAWFEPTATPGRGGFADAGTQEEIISAEFIKNRLIVYFERSTWELVDTGNTFKPFIWQKINTELGAESTFSIVPFDKNVLAIGDVGIHSCNGANVERIDEKIPDFVFTQRNQIEGVERVVGIRDYQVEMVYWTYPSTNSLTFNDQLIVYNYRVGNWSFNDDTITAFGYFQRDDNLRWNSTNATWAQLTQTWQSGVNVAQSRFVIAGNQQGYTFLVDADSNRNTPAMQITNILTTPTTQLTVINHNVLAGDYILIENAVFTGGAGLNNQIFQVQLVVDANTIDLGPAPFTGVYAGGGVITRISQIDIYTKQYNFFVDQDRNLQINKIDFQVDKIQDAEISIDVIPSASAFMVQTKILTLDAYMDALFAFEQQQNRLWHPVYVDAEGSFVQLRIYYSPTQMFNTDIVLSDFQLHSMLFYAEATANRLQ